MYSIFYDKKALKDIPKLKASKLDSKTKALIDILRENPYQSPPPYEKLQGDLQGAYSRRINIQHRLVYEVIEDIQTVKIISMWSHYEF
ncbi:Txe/YoeB family addiction module toxin [Clostridium formicaceticum]|uniref:Endoribonuclease YoeB n=1 Tax=Clostridium formicaceticum TaxID=1497 RepID=A0AAC9RIB6_9CLOT|nr:Txe/YoeB family addiction module toxin [Clostridium formicaceticum]AOY75755.1 addiction module toxin [Clostridium formicaceticum]ARE86079.1 Toxin RelK [Clostridium formicaceticum]